MKRHLFSVILALLGLCGSIYAQMANRSTDDDWDFCQEHCQPNQTGRCTVYTIGSDGGYGAFTCGVGVIIYDSEPEDE